MVHKASYDNSSTTGIFTNGIFGDPNSEIPIIDVD
jgi:hypothetical protein